MNRLVIIGASGHGRSVADAVVSEGRFELVGFVDRSAPVGSTCSGFEVLGDEPALPALVRDRGIEWALIAVGDNFVRARVAERLRAALPSLRFAAVVHGAAHVAADVAIGEGSVVFAGAVVNAGSRVGRFCIVNTRASLDHDGVLDDFASIAPGVTVGGNCSIGEHSAIGIGAVLSHGVRVGTHSVVGAASLVLADVPDRVVAYGTPARVVRARHPGDPYL